MHPVDRFIRKVSGHLTLINSSAWSLRCRCRSPVEVRLPNAEGAKVVKSHS